MENFNTVEFERNKIAGEVTKKLDDGTVVTQFGGPTGYYQKEIPPKGWFYVYKEFYGNGLLKTSGSLFKKGDYKTGSWQEFDSSGNKTRETNYDAGYTLQLEDILKILHDRGIKFSLEDRYNSIRRTVVNARPEWFVKWKEQEKRMERMEIDDAGGRIIKQDFYAVEEDH
ncbi:MAG: hypothetical protein ABI813_13390 [Bacteroidota bacterium]